MKKKYLNLIKELAISEFKLKYHGSLLGYLWSLVKPLLLFGVLYLVFNRLVKIGGDLPNYPVYLLLGVVLWMFFTEFTVSAMHSVTNRSELIKKIYFPRSILVLSTSISSFITLLLNLIAVYVFMLFSNVSLTPKILLFPFLLVEFYILALGCGLLLGALFVKYKDISHIWEVGLQILFYVHPIIYPLEIVPEKFARIIALSPLTQIIQDSREVLLTTQTRTASDFLNFPLILLPYMLPFLILVLGNMIFKKMSDKFAEEV